MSVKHAFAIAVAGALVAGTAAEVEASRSRHERAEVKPLKEGGEVVGITLKVTLLPYASSNHDKVRIGLGPNTMKSGTSWDDMRAMASDAKKGYLLHQFPEIKTDGKTKQEITLEVKFKDAPGLKPGTEFEVVSAWNSSATNKTYWHVWGLQGIQADKANVLKVPGKAAAKRRTVINEIKRSGKRSARSKSIRRRGRRPVQNRNRVKPKVKARR